MQDATALDHVLITRDKRIRKHPAELAMAVGVGARMFVLGGNGTKLDMLKALMIAWDRIHVVCAAETPPFIYTVHASGRLNRVHPRPA